MFRYLGIDVDIVHTARLEAAFLHTSPDVHRDLNCEIVPAHIAYSGVDVHALGTKELVAYSVKLKTRRSSSCLCLLICCVTPTRSLRASLDEGAMVHGVVGRVGIDIVLYCSKGELDENHVLLAITNTKEEYKLWLTERVETKLLK